MVKANRKRLSLLARAFREAVDRARQKIAEGEKT